MVGSYGRCHQQEAVAGKEGGREGGKEGGRGCSCKNEEFSGMGP